MTIRIEEYSHVIWDWNGTLLDDVELCASIMNELLKKESLPLISVEHYKNIFTFPVEEYYRIAGHNFINNSFEVLGKEFMDKYEKGKSGCRLYPGAEELLKEFNSGKINQHILSAYEQNSLSRIVEHFKIKEYFGFLVGLDNIYAGGKKNLAEKLLSMISHNGTEERILLLGDTLHDLEVAQSINADCVLIASGHQSKERLEGNGAPVCADLTEFRKSIEIKGI